MSRCDHKFVDSGICLKCGWAPSLGPAPEPQPADSYTDNVIAVMRSTIDAQRETIAAKDGTIAELRERCRRLTATLAACPSCTSMALKGERA